MPSFLGYPNPETAFAAEALTDPLSPWPTLGRKLLWETNLNRDETAQKLTQAMLEAVFDHVPLDLSEPYADLLANALARIDFDAIAEKLLPSPADVDEMRRDRDVHLRQIRSKIRRKS